MLKLIYVQISDGGFPHETLVKRIRTRFQKVSCNIFSLLSHAVTFVIFFAETLTNRLDSYNNRISCEIKQRCIYFCIIKKSNVLLRVRQN